MADVIDLFDDADHPSDRELLQIANVALGVCAEALLEIVVRRETDQPS